MKRNMLIPCLALWFTGCGLLRVPSTPDFTATTTAREVLVQARSSNWVIRVNTDSTQAEGRVRFVDHETARVADNPVILRDIRSIERHAEIELGGRPEGIMVGAGIGVVLGYLARGFWEYGWEQNCSFLCSVRIYAPTVVVTALIGGLVGSAVDPPDRQWAPIWTAPH